MKTSIVPEHRRLKYAATINDEALTEDTSPDYEMQYIDIGNVDSSGIISEIAAYRFEDAPSRARRLVRAGDVIISTVRTYLQAIASIDSPPENLVVSTGFAVVRPRQGVLDQSFCKYALREPLFLAEVEMRSTGVSYPAINASEIGDIRVHLPPIQKQRSIAIYLDSEMERVDALVVAKERWLGLLAEKRRALIAQAVTRGLNRNATLRDSDIPWLGEIPGNWNVRRLKRVVANVSSGVSVNATDRPVSEKELGVLKTSAVSTGRFFPEENKVVWRSEVNRVACPVRKKTIIMSRMNTPSLVAESAYVERDYPNLFLPDRLWQMEFDLKQVEPQFVAQVLASEGARFELSAMATGTSGSMKNLAKEDMLNLAVPLPPLDEQRTIVEYIETETAKLDRLRTAAERSIALLKERRGTLIAVAVTGKLEIPEAA